MSYFIDRRLNSRGKSTVNRRRFLERYRDHVKRAVADAVSRRSITDLEQGEDVVIPARDISEPVFHHGPGGRRGMVHPGNREFVTGDRIPRSGGGSGSGGDGDASNQGEGEDDFVFQISHAEFLDYLFDDLELPNLHRRRLKGNTSLQYERAGFSTDGTPAKLSVVRSMKASKARRMALTGTTRREIEAAEALLEAAERDGDEVSARRLEIEIEHLKQRLARVPYLDTHDLRYNLHVQRPTPIAQAVMFCVMDVSGSMDQATKDLAKRFYLLLYLFLKRHYQRTELVFIRHHTVAKAVEEDEFFHSRETGGTVVSSALKLMGEIIRDRYPPNEWNIYGAQASDGDNWRDDSPLCSELMREVILPLTQFYAYVEICRGSHQELWHCYEDLAAQFPGVLALRHIREAGDIFPVFHDLFQRRNAA